MNNRYPLWKNLLILTIALCGFYYAAPNLYAPDPALQIAGASSPLQIDDRILSRAETALPEAGIGFVRQPLPHVVRAGPDGVASVRLHIAHIELDEVCSAVALVVCTVVFFNLDGERRDDAVQTARL